MKIFHIRSFRIIAFLFLLSLGNFGLFSGLNAQTSGSSGKSSNLYMQVRTTPEKKLLISWTPLDTLTFKQGFKQGYTLTRYDSTTNQVTLLSDRILPKDTIDFYTVMRKDTTQSNYYSNVLNWVIFAKDSPTVQMRYMQLISNGHEDPQTAALSGLGWIDSTELAEGGRYRYDLQLNGGSLATQVGIEYNPISVYGTNGATFPTLDFGNTPQLSSFMNRKIATNIFGVAKAFGDSIYLRWAPDSYAGWVAGNKKGYRIIRFESTRKRGLDSLSAGTDTLQIAKIEATQIGFDSISVVIDTLRPQPLTYFAQEHIKIDTGCIIAAQALYGQTIQIAGDASIADKESQAQMRFTIALQAADKSFKGAQALALGFIDHKVDSNKQYSYQIMPLDGGNPATIDIFNRKQPLPIPKDIQAKQGDEWLQLSWSFENQKDFVSYRVYRSGDDGKTYDLVTPEPLVFMLQGNEPDTFRYTFTDSVGVNYKKFKYRLSGSDMFAEWSPFAEVESYARDFTPPVVPFITEGHSTTRSFELSWSLDSMDTDLSGFQILMGNSQEGPFSPITKMLPKELRQYKHLDSVSLTRSYYFVVASHDTSGNIAYSMPLYILVIDSIPPLAPTLLQGKINKKGIVRMVWQHGTEEDLAGYRIYSSTNNRDFRMLTASPIDSNRYQDTLPLNTLNRKMYYKLIAEDQNANKSTYSEVLMLEKPDTISPVTPVMAQSESGAKGVTLKWIPSSSNDVMAHLVYRKVDKDTTANWALFQKLDARTEWFTDTTAFIEKPYLYYMVAQDSAENVSEPSLTVGGRRFFDGKSDGIKTLQAVFDEKQKTIQVSWQIAPVTDPFLKDKKYYIFIYRAKQNEPLEKYQQVEGEKLPAFVDDEVAKGQYRYALCMAYDDGKITPLTQEVVVDIE
jgi:uncharacterized protein